MAKIRLVIFDQVHIATLTNAQELLVKEAQARRTGYQATVPNPNFKPNLAQDGGNTPTIANPQTKEDYIANKILDDTIGSAKQMKREEIQRIKTQEAETDLSTTFAGITIAKEVVP